MCNIPRRIWQYLEMPQWVHLGVLWGQVEGGLLRIFSRYARGGLGGCRRFELLGEGPGGVPLWIISIWGGGGGVMKQMRLPTSYSRYSWSVE